MKKLDNKINPLMKESGHICLNCNHIFIGNIENDRFDEFPFCPECHDSSIMLYQDFLNEQLKNHNSQSSDKYIESILTIINNEIKEFFINELGITNISEDVYLNGFIFSPEVQWFSYSNLELKASVLDNMTVVDVKNMTNDLLERISHILIEGFKEWSIQISTKEVRPFRSRNYNKITVSLKRNLELRII